MSIHRFFDRQVIIYRTKSLGGIKRIMASTATVEGHIQSASLETKELLGVVEADVYTGWFDEDCIIQEGDKITDEEGTRFEVKEVIKKDYGINQHKQVVLLKVNA